MTYIYALVDPVEKRIRYIGKSDNPSGRLNAHVYEAMEIDSFIPNAPIWPRCVWIYRLIKNGLRPEIVILEKCKEDNWRETEDWWIGIFENEGILNARRVAGKYPPAKSIRKYQMQEFNHD